MSELPLQPMPEPSGVPAPYHQEASDPMLALIERAARDPQVDVDKMERLLVMAEKVQARRAETAYNDSMSAAQAEMRPVARDSENPQTRSRYTSYGALDNAVRPIYSEHGFSLSFGTRSPRPDVVTVTCRVSHRAGHKEIVEIDMPSDGKGARGGDVMTKTHATGSAVSYGMRYLLKMIFNIAMGEYDDDGNAAGKKPAGPPASQQAQHHQKPVSAAPTPQKANSGPAKGISALEAWLEKCRVKLVADLAVHGQAAVDYAVNAGLILPNEALSDAKAAAWFPKINHSLGVAENTPIVKEARDMHLRGIQAQMDGEKVPSAPGKPVPGAPPAPPTGAKPGPAAAMHAAADAPAKVVPTTCPHCDSTATKPDPEFVDTQICQKCGWRWDENGDYCEEHPWMEVICPIPPPGMRRIDYNLDPITMGQMCRTDNGRWYGMVKNTTVAEVRQGRDFKGKHYDASDADLAWAEACEQAAAHLEASKKDSPGRDPEAPADDIPF